MVALFSMRTGIYPSTRLVFSIRKAPFSQKTIEQTTLRLSEQITSFIRKQQPFGSPPLPQNQVHKMMTQLILTTKKIPPLDQNIAKSIKTAIAESSSKALREIMARQLGSQRGVMYLPTYFQEIEKEEHKEYLDYCLEKIESPPDYRCFKTKKNDFFHFTARPQFLASESLHSFLIGPTAAECGSTTEAVFFKIMLDLLGEERFNALFSTNENPFQIKKWGGDDSFSSLYPFIEPVNPDFEASINPNELEVGDHIFLQGVPWYRVKHPLGHMGGMHGIVVGFNEEKKPLIGGMEFSQPKTIEEIYVELLNEYNKPQTYEDAYFYQKNWSLEQQATIKGEEGPFHCEMKMYPFLKNEQAIFESYSIEKIQELGGCVAKNRNAYRLSPLVLSRLSDPIYTLKELPAAANLGKIITLSKHLLALKTP